MHHTTAVLASIAALWLAAVLPAHPSLSLGLISVATMIAIALAWYGLVVLVLTARPAAAAFARIRHWIDRIAGVFFMVFGAKLALQR
jgi:threonine/homoserine/homoserine lactone efflux protein